MAVQLGFATMPLGVLAKAWPFTTGTTRGGSGSIRQADVLSMAIAPAAASRGLSSRDDDELVEQRAMSMPSRFAVAASSTTTSPSPQARWLPADGAGARKRAWATGSR